MPLTQILDSYTFRQWRDECNAIITAIGSQLSTIPVPDNITSSINNLKDKIGVLTDLNTTSKTSIVLALNEVNSKIGTLSSLNTSIKTNIVASINSLITVIGSLSSLNTESKSDIVTATNEVLDRISDTTDSFEHNFGRMSDDITKVLTASSISNLKLKSYNASTLTATSKFIDNNTDFGGTAGSLNVDSLSLVDALDTKAGRTEKRYGSEFYILDITSGNGTIDAITHNSKTYHPCISNDSIVLHRIGKYVTWTGWVRLKTLNTGSNNGILLGKTGITTHIDGVVQAGVYLLTTASGWVHVRQTKLLTTEYENFIPAIASNDLDVVQIALPGYFKGLINTGMHKGLI